MLRPSPRAARGHRALLLAASALALLPALVVPGLDAVPLGAAPPAVTRPVAATTTFGAGGAALPSGAATTAAADNPLAGRPWGVYRGNAEMAWPPFSAAAPGPDRDLLARIALRPKAKWFGDWIPDAEIADKVTEYVDSVLASTGGDPETLVQMTVFRVEPWEQTACTRLPTKAEKTSYRAWIDAFAGAVGSTHAMIVVQPDGPFALCAPRGSRAYSKLVRYGVERFAALPNTSVYLEAGAADWHRKKTAPAVELLVHGGVAAARGFVLNTTHYDTTRQQVRYGAKVVEALAAQGIPGKRFLVDTSSNGRPFTGVQWRAAGSQGGRFDNAATCTGPAQTRCVTLGIPPTWAVADPVWGLPEKHRLLAASLVDGFVWAGRPWLTNATAPFDAARARAVAATTPWAGIPVPVLVD